MWQNRKYLLQFDFDGMWQNQIYIYEMHLLYYNLSCKKHEYVSTSHSLPYLQSYDIDLL